MIRKLIIGALVSVVLVGALILFLLIEVTADLDSAPVSEGELWFDDWYTLTYIDAQTIAIGEPRYWQKNYNYLLLGNKRAILFDTGAGVRNIRRVVDTLTDLPVTVISSHRHYDHIGNNFRFESVAAIDVPALREQMTGGVYQPSFRTAFTVRRIKPFKITEWWPAEQSVDLGKRRVQVLHIPGHADGSIALSDAERAQLFTGDFIYPGWLVGFAPSSNFEKYVESAKYLLAQTTGAETLYGAHADAKHPSPALPYSGLVDLKDGLEQMLAGRREARNSFPLRSYPINADMEMFTWIFSTVRRD